MAKVFKARVALITLLLAAALTFPIYPVEVESCPGFVELDDRPDCSRYMGLHTTYTVVSNGFSYDTGDIGVQVLDASISYRASPLFLAILAAWFAAFWLVSKPALEAVSDHLEADIL